MQPTPLRGAAYAERWATTILSNIFYKDKDRVTEEQIISEYNLSC
jgi:hypothetical protein